MFKLIKDNIKKNKQERLEREERIRKEEQERVEIQKRIAQEEFERKEKERLECEERIRKEEQERVEMQKRMAQEELERKEKERLEREERIRKEEQERVEMQKRMAQEELERKEKERLELYDDFSNEIRRNYRAVYKMWSNVTCGIYFGAEILNMFNVFISEKSINDAFWEIYKTSKDITSLQVFDEKISVKRADIINQKLNFASLVDKDIAMIFTDYIKIYDEHKDVIMVEGANGTMGVIKYAINHVTEEAATQFGKTTSTNLAIVMLYFYIEALVRTLVLFRSEEHLIDSKEFYTIQKNLFNEFTLEEVISKLYPIYERFYSDTFDEKFTYQRLQVLVYMINTKENNTTSSQFIDTFKEVARDSNDETLQERLEKLNNYDDILFIITKFVDLDMLTEANEDDAVFIYLELIYELLGTLKGNEIISLFVSLTKIRNDVNEYIENKKLLQERERYLNCNFDKERNLENEKLKLSLVYNGIQFEQYLKNLFEKLGYLVEVTKSTGDQGADLILTKNNEKTVVQAKFYSSSVGNKAVQEVVAALKFYNADKGMVVTNSYYTKSAIELAEANGIELWNKEVLENMILKI